MLGAARSGGLAMNYGKVAHRPIRLWRLVSVADDRQPKVLSRFVKRHMGGDDLPTRFKQGLHGGTDVHEGILSQNRWQLSSRSALRHGGGHRSGLHKRFIDRALGGDQGFSD
jgi:hypothetical protein